MSRTAPRVGLEPTTLRLTAACSTIELSRNGVLTKQPGMLLRVDQRYPEFGQKSMRASFLNALCGKSSDVGSSLHGTRLDQSAVSQDNHCLNND